MTQQGRKRREREERSARSSLSSAIKKKENSLSNFRAEIFTKYSRIDRDDRRSARTNPWTDGWKGCFVTGRPLGFADASGVATRRKQQRGVIGREKERETTYLKQSIRSGEDNK